jgi:hypothetical protein
MTKKRVKFKDWVYENGGPTAISRKLKVERGTIYDWIDGKTHPSLRIFVKILELSNGKITINDFVK